ncbi:RHS repeat-associated core domain-containing protein [Caenimonas terrae]|uniref:RHS repeat-associated core domain-containing protein n=1 Tax=Caenimonas terrae TaxID=696074 RepID=A0ABW0NBX2_9BURK
MLDRSAAAPLGCASGEGGFMSCPPNSGSPPVDPPPVPPGAPAGAGPGPNGGPPGDPWSPDAVGEPPPPDEPPVQPTADDGNTCGAAVEAAGNPIFTATGNKFQQEVDYRGPHGLNLVRRYNSSLPGWVHNYSVRVFAGAALARVIRPDGRAHLFSGNGAGEWTGEAAARERLFKLAPADASQPSWKYVTANNATEWYDAQGRILSITRNGGMSYTFEQRDGLLRSVRDSFGAALQFAYDGQNRLVGVTTPEATTITYGYDGQGRLSQVGYPDGSSRSYLYEDTSYPLALTGLVDERGIRLATWAYDAAGRAVSSEHAGGVDRYQLVFNSDGSVVVTDPLGMTRTQAYSKAGARQVFAGQIQPCTNCSRDAASNVVDAATGLLVQSTDYLGVATLFTNDLQRKLPVTVTRAAGRPEQQLRRSDWAPNVRLPALVSEAGRTTAYSYDDAGNKLSQTVTDLASGQARSWQWTYTAQGLVATMTDPKGAMWSFGYDSAGNRVSVTNPLGQQTSASYDAAGRITSQTAPNGMVTTFAYDGRGRLVQQVRGGDSSSYGYTPAGQLASATMPNGYQVSYSYDAAQRLVGASDNRGASVQYTLDAAGNRVREEVRDASGAIALVTSRVINSLNQVAALQGAAGQTTALAYDGNGEPVAQTDPLNQTTRQSLDGLRRPVATTFADNTSATQAWNQLDQLTRVTDPKGVATAYQTNAFGEVVSESSPDIGSMRYQRDAAGEVTGITDAVGNVTAITRDALGRPTTIEYSSDNLAAFSYDQGQAGYLSKIDDKSGSTTYVRDAQGRVLAKTQAVNDNPARPSQFKVQYGYTGGELASITYPSGLKVTYNRVAGRIAGIDVQEPSSNPLRSKPVVPFVSNITHTALGQPRTWAWTSGDQASRTFDTDGRMSATEFSSYVYDAAGRITGITQGLWASRAAGPAAGKQAYTTPVSWTAGYDSRNRLTSLARDGASSRYTYDANSNRLTAVDSATSDSDLDGVLDAGDFTQSTSQTLNVEAASNRLLGLAQTVARTQNGKTRSVLTTFSYSLDANGAMTGDGLRTFEYDAARRLSKVRISRDREAARVGYLHNALGQRVFKTEATADQTVPDRAVLGQGFIDWLQANFRWMFLADRESNSVGTAFVYDEAGSLLGEYDNGSSAGRGAQEYIWLPTDDGQAIPIGIYSRNRFYAVHADHLGTPRLITDDDNKPVWQWPYSAFGSNKPTGVLKATPNPKATGSKQDVALNATDTALEVNLRFPGQYFDEESNLSYNYFRSYNAAQGRYSQPDPIGLDGGWNRFSYVRGNPLSMSDPEGLLGRAPGKGPSPPLPYAPGFSPQMCNGYYSPGTTLNLICSNTGDEPVANCARQCLHDALPVNSCGKTNPVQSMTQPPASWYYDDHPRCWSQCRWPLGQP